MTHQGVIRLCWFFVEVVNAHVNQSLIVSVNLRPSPKVDSIGPMPCLGELSSKEEIQANFQS